jgi:hypothetical protein
VACMAPCSFIAIFQLPCFRGSLSRNNFMSSYWINSGLFIRSNMVYRIGKALPYYSLKCVANPFGPAQIRKFQSCPAALSNATRLRCTGCGDFCTSINSRLGSYSLLDFHRSLLTHSFLHFVIHLVEIKRQTCCFSLLGCICMEPFIRRL